MEVGIKVIAENIQTHVVHHANSCFFAMVAVDDDRKPVSAPVFRPASADEHRRQAAAVVRKQLRQEFVRRFDEIRTDHSAGWLFR